MMSAGRVLFAIAIAVSSTTRAAEPAADKSAVKKPASIEAVTRANDLIKGFFNVYADAAGGRVLLEVRETHVPFLLVTSLPWGLGSNDVGLDRGQSGESHIVEFRRAGTRVLLVEDNTKFRAVSNDGYEERSVREAFAESVLWA